MLLTRSVPLRCTMSVATSCTVLSSLVLVIAVVCVQHRVDSRLVYTDSNHLDKIRQSLWGTAGRDFSDSSPQSAAEKRSLVKLLMKRKLGYKIGFQPSDGPNGGYSSGGGGNPGSNTAAARGRSRQCYWNPVTCFGRRR